MADMINAAQQQGLKFLNRDFAAQFLSAKTGNQLLAGTSTESTLSRLEQVQKELIAKVKGQEQAVTSVVRSLRRVGAGMQDQKKPLASFLFFGPTGVGKTYLAEVLAESFFGAPSLVLRLDMSEYQREPEAALQKLLGATINGQFSEGVLAKFILAHPYSLILVDEVEKATQAVLDLFLQILDAGRATDGAERVLDFSNSMIIATSNVAAREVLSGFQAGQGYSQVYSGAKAKLMQQFRPEFLNRFDELVLFQPLNKPTAQDIVTQLLNFEKQKLAGRGVEFIFSDKLVQRILSVGYSPEFGARELKRTVVKLVEDAVAQGLLAGKLKPGDVFSLE